MTYVCKVKTIVQSLDFHVGREFMNQFDTKLMDALIGWSGDGANIGVYTESTDTLRTFSYMPDYCNYVGISTSTWNVGSQVSNRWALRRNIRSRQWALDRYKLLNSFNVMQPFQKVLFSEGVLQSLPNKSVRYEDYPNEKTVGGITPPNSYLRWFKFGSDEQPQYNLIYEYPYYGITTKNPFGLTKSPYKIEAMLRDGYGSDWTGTSLSKLSTKRILIDQKYISNCIFNELPNGNSYYQPEQPLMQPSGQDLSNKKKLAEDGRGGYFFSTWWLNATAGDFYDPPETWQGISYDDFLIR